MYYYVISGEQLNTLYALAAQERLEDLIEEIEILTDDSFSYNGEMNPKQVNSFVKEILKKAENEEADISDIPAKGEEEDGETVVSEGLSFKNEGLTTNINIPKRKHKEMFAWGTIQRDWNSNN
jgi:polyhydroxyalkanoate synthesis regulator phasin